MQMAYMRLDPKLTRKPSSKYVIQCGGGKEGGGGKLQDTKINNKIIYIKYIKIHYTVMAELRLLHSHPFTSSHLHSVITVECAKLETWQNIKTSKNKIMPISKTEFLPNKTHTSFLL